MKRPVVEIVGVDERLVDAQAVFGSVRVARVAGLGVEADLVAGVVIGVENLEKPLVGPRLVGGVVGIDKAERGFHVVAGDGGDECEDMIAQVAAERGLVFGVGDLRLELRDLLGCPLRATPTVPI